MVCKVGVDQTLSPKSMCLHSLLQFKHFVVFCGTMKRQRGYEETERKVKKVKVDEHAPDEEDARSEVDDSRMQEVKWMTQACQVGYRLFKRDICRKIVHM